MPIRAQTDSQTRSLASHLPIFWHKLLPEPVLNLSLAESAVECFSCGRGRSLPSGANTKCCAYQPDLSNFLAGFYLQYQGAAGQWLKLCLSNSSSYSQKPAVVLPAPSPLGLRAQWSLSEGPSDQDLLCPLFDRQHGRCRVWSERPVVCAGFFCVSSYGERGLQFWRKLEEYLFYLEACLSQWALLEHGFSWPEIQRALAGVPDWAHWQGRASELYMSCAAWVRGLNRTELAKLAGEPANKMALELMVQAAQMLGQPADQLPP